MVGERFRLHGLSRPLWENLEMITQGWAGELTLLRAGEKVF